MREAGASLTETSNEANEIMPGEVSAAQDTLKRLMQAEKEASEILRSEEERSKETLANAQEQAKQQIEGVRREMEDTLRSRLHEAESKAATELNARLDEVAVGAQGIERRAKEHLSDAVEMVVSWITNGGE